VVNVAQYSFFGYRRENGRCGIRNHVIILPLDDLSNASAEAVANNIKGTLALPHAYGRLQFGEDLELFFAVGYRVAQADRYPEWSPGTEFKAKRDAMLKR